MTIEQAIAQYEQFANVCEYHGLTTSQEEFEQMIAWLRELQERRKEPAIPVAWIEKHIEWLKSLDNEFANLAAAHISVMLKKWRSEQNETD